MPDKKQPEITKQPEPTGGEDAAPPAKAVELVTEAVKVAVEASLPPRAAHPAAPNRREAASPVPVAPPIAAVAPVAASEPAPDAPPPAEPQLVEPQPIATAAAPVAEPVAALAPAPSLSMPSLPSPSLASPSRPTASIPNRHTMETMMTTAEEMISFQQGNLEALMKSGQIWAAGLQDMSRHWAAAAQATLDETMGTVKAMSQVKSLREAMELQSTLARTSVEKVVSEGGKLTDASLKLAEQTFAPISARLTLAAERFGRPTA